MPEPTESDIERSARERREKRQRGGKKQPDRGAYGDVPDPLQDRDESTARRGTSAWEDTTDGAAIDEAGAVAAPDPREEYAVGYGQNDDPEDDSYSGTRLAPREPEDPKDRSAPREDEREIEHDREPRRTDEPRRSPDRS